MGKSTIQLLKKALKRSSTLDLQEIETLANKVLKEYKTLDVYYKGKTLLEMAYFSDSQDAVKLFIKLGADPFFINPDKPSVIERLAADYFNLMESKDKTKVFPWLLESEDSPIFTWAKLKTNPTLYEEFKKAQLIPPKRFINELPLHVAVKAGRIDLVKIIINTAGTIQKAGDISKLSILNPAIMATLNSKKGALELLQYLLVKGAGLDTQNLYGLSAITQAITAETFTLDQVKEEAVLAVVKLLINHGANWNGVNPNNHYTPLMSAMSMGYNKLFDFLLELADTNNINHRARFKPYYLLFQILDKEDNRLGGLDIPKLLSMLKENGLQFGITINVDRPMVHPFQEDLYFWHSSNTNVYGRNLSPLHYYASTIALDHHDLFSEIDNHLKIIATLIRLAVDPDLKAIYTETKTEDNWLTRQQTKVEIQKKLTAAEYWREIAAHALRHHHSNAAYYIKRSASEMQFLESIDHLSSTDKVNFHKKFHQFRNIERALAGKPPLTYSGLPSLTKMNQFNKKLKLASEVNHETKAQPNPAINSTPILQTVGAPYTAPAPQQEQKTKLPATDSGATAAMPQVITPQPVSTALPKPDTALQATKQVDLIKLEDTLLKARAQHNRDQWRSLKNTLVDYVKDAESLTDFLERLEQFKKPLQLHFDTAVNPKGEVTNGSILYRFFHYFEPHKFPNSWETLKAFAKDNYGVDINLQYVTAPANRV